MARKRTLTIAKVDGLSIERDPDRSSGRLLRQDDMDASYVDLGDARHLEFSYLRWIRLVLRAFETKRVLHIGGGACSLARALLAEDRESRHEVVEVDGQVFELARAHLGLRRQPGLRLRVADGRATIADRADGSVDAIVIDAFVGARVPRHLVTVEALTQCARVAPLTVVNVVDSAALPGARAIVAGLSEVYPHVAGIATAARRSGNFVVFGSRDQPRYRSLEANAAADASAARILPGSDFRGVGAWYDRD